MKYGRTGCAVVRGNGEVRNEIGGEDCTQTGDQMLAEGKNIKRCVGRGSHLLVQEKSKENGKGG